MITAGLHLHDRRQRHRAPRRRQDRRLLHRRASSLVSLLSRLARAFELRTTDVVLRRARRALPPRLRPPHDPARRQRARRPRHRPSTATRSQQILDDNDLPDAGDIIFVEVTVTDPSDFESRHRGPRRGPARPLPRAHRARRRPCPTPWPRCCSHVRDRTGVTPHIYFEWTEGNPVVNLLRFLLFGVGRGRPRHPRGPPRAEPDRGTAAPTSTPADRPPVATSIRMDQPSRVGSPLPGGTDRVDSEVTPLEPSDEHAGGVTL